MTQRSYLETTRQIRITLRPDASFQVKAVAVPLIDQVCASPGRVARRAS